MSRKEKIIRNTKDREMFAVIKQGEEKVVEEMGSITCKTFNTRNRISRESRDRMKYV